MLTRQRFPFGLSRNFATKGYYGTIYWHGTEPTIPTEKGYLKRETDRGDFQENPPREPESLNARHAMPFSFLGQRMLCRSRCSSVRSGTSTSPLHGSDRQAHSGGQLVTWNRRLCYNSRWLARENVRFTVCVQRHMSFSEGLIPFPAGGCVQSSNEVESWEVLRQFHPKATTLVLRYLRMILKFSQDPLWSPELWCERGRNSSAGASHLLSSPKHGIGP